MMRDFRIAYLFARYPNHAQPYCDTEIVALDSLGVELEIDALRPSRSTLRHANAAERRVETYYPPSIAIRGQETRLTNALATEHRSTLLDPNETHVAAQVQALIPGLERRSVRHVHVHFTGHAARVALVLKQTAGMPFSVTSHGPHPVPTPEEASLLRTLAREAEFMVAVSDWSLARLREICREHAHKIERIYNGIDLDEFGPPVPALVRARPRIASVGRLVEFKGFDVLVEACAELQQLGQDFECTLVGEGIARAEIEASIRAHELQDNVRLVGVRTQEEVRAILRSSDVFTLASRMDSRGASDVVPTVILEAMATGLPVVSTRLAGIPEQVEDGTTGLLVEPGDSRGLAAALHSVLRSVDDRQLFGAAGRARAERIFRAERSASALLERFLRCAKSPPVVAVPRSPGPTTAWLVDRWPAPEIEKLGGEVRARARDPATVVFVGAYDEEFSAESDANLALVARLEPLPDAGVLEARWLASPDARSTLDTVRETMHRRLRGEEYYRDARRAVWLADELRQRGIAHLHAARGSAMLCAYLVKKLAGLRVTYALGPCSGRRKRAHEQLAAELDTGTPYDSNALARTFRHHARVR